MILYKAFVYKMINLYIRRSTPYLTFNRL